MNEHPKHRNTEGSLLKRYNISARFVFIVIMFSKKTKVP